ACYDCLLSYGNQPLHRKLDRRLVRDLLLALAGARTERVTPDPDDSSRGTAGSVDNGEADGALMHPDTGDEAGAVLAWLRERGHRLPDGSDADIPAGGVRPGLVYRREGGGAVVYVGGEADRHADERLRDMGWLVLHLSGEAGSGEAQSGEAQSGEAQSEEAQ